MSAPMQSFLYRQNFISLLLKKLKHTKKDVCSCMFATTTHRLKDERRQSSTKYCFDSVRQNDFEGYLCVLMYPAKIRKAAVAIKAFNVETSQIEDSVKEKMAGVGRVQFWKDTIENIYKGNPPKTPVAVELASVLQNHKLNKRWFQRMLEARATRIENNVYRTVEDMETYSENTMSSMLYLHLESLGTQNVHADHAASHLGRAHGLVTLLRAAPYVGAKGKVYLPLDLMAKHRLSQEEVFRGKKEQEVCDIAFEVACVAKRHLEIARSLSKDVPSEAVPIFINSLICDIYLKKLETVRFFIFDKSLQKKDGLLPMKMWIHSKRRIY